MQQGPPRIRRARPVADAPVEALLAGVQTLTKGWLLALLEQAPLEQAPGILAAEVVREGPPLCEAIVRALASDAALQQISAGGSLERLVGRIGELAGADGLEAAVRAVDTLQGVIWSAIRAEVRADDEERLPELAERLGLVAGVVRAAVLRRAGGRAAEAAAPEPGDPEAEAVERREAAPPRGEEAVERREEAIPPRDPRGEEAVAEPVERRERAVAEPVERRERPEPPLVVPPRRLEGTLWVRAFEHEIGRAEQSGSPLSLLLVELEEADRVLAVEPETESAATFGRFAAAVRAVVRRQDILVSETEFRVWIIARETGRPGAQALGTRIADAVRREQPWRGAPMTVTVGVSVLGEDGRDTDTLIEAAEQARFVASASGIEIVRVSPPEGNAGA